MSKTLAQLNKRSNELARSAKTLSANITAHCTEIVAHVIEHNDVRPFTYLVDQFAGSAVRKEAIVQWVAAFGGGKYMSARAETAKSPAKPAQFVRNDVPQSALSVENLPDVFSYTAEKVTTVNAIDLMNLIKGLVKRVDEGKDKVPTKANTKHNIPVDKLEALRALIA